MTIRCPYCDQLHYHRHMCDPAKAVLDHLASSGQVEGLLAYLGSQGILPPYPPVLSTGPGPVPCPPLTGTPELPG